MGVGLQRGTPVVNGGTVLWKQACHFCCGLAVKLPSKTMSQTSTDKQPDKSDKQPTYESKQSSLLASSPQN
jgi:hypothetical protein